MPCRWIRFIPDELVRPMLVKLFLTLNRFARKSDFVMNYLVHFEPKKANIFTISAILSSGFMLTEFKGQLHWTGGRGRSM